MSKDPAFLFYSKDWYEGTRMMLPEERACYMDLLIYQHQNGIIPNEIKRVLMYCSGIDEATLKATLQAKFKQTDKGWINEKLKVVVSDRENYTNRQSVNGQIGQFWKKSKAILSISEYKELRKTLVNIDNNELLKFLKDKNIDEATLKGLLKAPLKHLAIANAIEDVIENKDENVIGIKSAKIEFQKIVDIFNSVCKHLPSVQKVTKQRESSINARVTEYGLSKIGDVFQLVSQSSFLNGENDRNWKADFDWVMNPNNFIKILEGKYNGKPKQQNSQNNQGASSDFRRKTAERVGIVQPD